MGSFAVLSAVGPDRTGLVAELSEFLLRRGANIEDSRMSVLGGDFAVILLFSAGEAELDDIVEAGGALGKATGLSVMLRRTAERPAPAGPSLVWRVRAVAMDHPGIVHRLAQAVARLGFNIVELQSHTAPAPVSGTPVFSMEMQVSVPAHEKPGLLRTELARIGEAEAVDIEIRPVEGGLSP
jgi:glycine cleavage system transcriptional repressor